MRGVNEERLLLWIEALESGEWKQCENVLEHVDPEDGSTSHCCLGVAQRIAFANGFNDTDPSDMYWGSSGMDPRVGQWYGFNLYNQGDPLLVEGDSAEGTQVITCVDANDKYGWSFAQIAAGLRARYITQNIEEETSA